MSGDGDGKRAGALGEGSELIDLLKRYVVQETVTPLKSAGRTLLFGSAAALLLGIGAVLLLVGVLRVLQTETGSTFAGSLSWLPYWITAACGLVIVGGSAFVVLRGPRGKGSKSRKGKTMKQSEVG
jgi:hypothetical protein